MGPGGGIEVLRPGLPRGRFRAALFDFDGTLSLVREGWAEVMVGLAVAALREAGAAGPDAALAAGVEEWVMALNGRPTIFQMARLAEEVRGLGGRALEPAAYQRLYEARLMERVEARLAAVRPGRAAARAWAVPGSHALLAALRRRGVALYLASGTELRHVRREAGLLGLAGYFGEHVYAPADGGGAFAKRDVIERILAGGLGGAELVGFGDGVVETEEVRRAGGVAVAVASHEPGRAGVNAAKRARLVRAGADVVIADYRGHRRLLRWLFADG
jgi:phosphoglycolate phosphatase-like HAD superfamily hydrolase